MLSNQSLQIARYRWWNIGFEPSESAVNYSAPIVFAFRVPYSVVTSIWRWPELSLYCPGSLIVKICLHKQYWPMRLVKLLDCNSVPDKTQSCCQGWFVIHVHKYKELLLKVFCSYVAFFWFVDKWLHAIALPPDPMLYWHGLIVRHKY